MKTEQMIKELIDNGFTFIYKDEFDRPDHIDCSPKDDLYIFFNYDKGILAYFDTFFNKKSVNSGYLFYNHASPIDGKNNIAMYSSGGYYFSSRNEEYPDLYKNGRIKPCSEVFKEKRQSYFDLEISWEEYTKYLNEFDKRYKSCIEGKGYSYVWSGYEDIKNGVFFHEGEYLKQWVDSRLCRTLQIYLHDHDSKLNWKDKEGAGYKRLCKLPGVIKQRILFKEG